MAQMNANILELRRRAALRKSAPEFEGCHREFARIRAIRGLSIASVVSLSWLHARSGFASLRF